MKRVVFVLSLAACLPKGITEGATCCVCLASHAPDGSQDQSVEGNCLPDQATADDESSECSDQTARTITGNGATGIKVVDEACGTSTCEAECSGWLEVGDLVVGEGEGEGDAGE